MAASTLATLRDSAKSAVASGDYASALSYARQALVEISTAPSRSKHGNQELEWDADAIKTFIREMERASSGSTGIQRTKITKTRVSE